MFFKKKPKPVEAPTISEGREQYRKRNPRVQPLEAQLKVTGWPTLHVELLDLSVRGAGVRLPFAQDRNLQPDDIVELVIGSMMRNEISTAARVANVGREGEGHVRYGLEFVNLGNLYSQLDSFYSRHFNRRRHLRVLPALDRKIHAMVRWNGGELRVPVFDVSESGLGLVLTKDSAARTAEITEFDVEVRLPGQENPLRGNVRTQHRSPLHQNILLGVKFELEGPSGWSLHLGAIRAVVEQRAAEMALWEKKWS